MKLNWEIESQDITNIKSFLTKHEDNNFVRKRIKRNISNQIPVFSKDEFWKLMVACLLTTQQRSGPNSSVSKFIIQQPFPLSLDFCSKAKNIQVDSFTILSKAGGLRRTNKISDEISVNLAWLNNDGWSKILHIGHKLLELRTQNPNPESIPVERQACLLVQNLKGIGPKQSRNLWQALGLIRYEIPIDSRIIKWLNNNKFPFILSATALSDENYYQLIMNGIQQWCKIINVPPCVLDAAIFSSYDEEWPENYELW